MPTLRAFTITLWLAAILSSADLAHAQATLVVQADPTTLGPIFYPSSLVVAFDVTGLDTVQSVSVSLTISHPSVAGVDVQLVNPQGVSEIVAPRIPYNADLEGAYTFSDRATAQYVPIAVAAGSGVVPPGAYRASKTVGGVTPVLVSLDTVFGSRPATGRWRLSVIPYFDTTPRGTVTAASLTIVGDPTATASATPGSLGTIPDGPSMTPQTPGPPRDVNFTIPPGRGAVRAVRVSTTMTHARVGDLVARLIAPTGQSHVLFGYTGARSATSFGSTARLNGQSEFRDDGTYDWWAIAADFEGWDMLPGSYTTAQPGGTGSTGAVTSIDSAFASVPSNGVWTLRLTDGAAASVGSISAASLTLVTDPTPSTFAEGYATTYATPLNIAAPGVLANDTDNLGGAMSAQLVSGPSSGALSLSPAGGFTYTPAFGFTGVDSFAYRATNAGGPGNVATVTITVAAPTTAQPPTAFVASSIAGNRVTLRWTASTVGPPATDYVVEGGVAPGQVLGGVAVGSALPILTFSAPTGAFFLRVHAIDATGLRSGPSNEIPLFVNTAAAPSAPAALTGSVDGNAVSLSWRTTFAGGAPTSAQLNVAGSAVAALALPLGETFTFAGVPAGTYTFRVRALNATGASLDSNPVTLTFPTGCTGVPAAPPNFLAYATGNVVRLVWDPPTSGAAATSYVVSVGGAFTGSLPLSARVFESPAPSGAYTFAVAGVNSCGTGPATSLQTVFVP